VPNLDSLVRTPSHFGSVSLRDAVQARSEDSSKSPNYFLTELLNTLHVRQGINHPEVNLVERIPALFEVAINDEDLNKLLVNHVLHDLYVPIFESHGMSEAIYRILDFDFSEYSEEADTILNEISLFINTVFNEHVINWQSAVKSRQALNTELILLRSSREKGKISQEKFLDEEVRLNQEIADVNAAFAVIRLQMTSFRALERVSRSLKLFVGKKEDFNTTTQLGVTITALSHVLASYPELWDVEVQVTDTLLQLR